jgi:glyoxylase-like metal-dependent hydrolase (beta-lactamase superfamily II)
VLKVGAVKITKIVEWEVIGGLFVLPEAVPEKIKKEAWLFPHFADKEGELKLVVQSFVIETPHRRILVDPGLGNNKKGRPVPDWNDRQGPFLADMAAAGFPPETIDTVISTHLHLDHVGWNTRLIDGRWEPTFKNARYVASRAEFDFWKDRREPDVVAVFKDSIEPVADAGMLDLVSPHHRLCEEVVLIPTPGHTPAHFSLEIRSQGERAILAGDLLIHPCQIAYPEWAAVSDLAPDQASRSRREILAKLANTDTLLLAAHFTAAGRIKSDGNLFHLAA